MLAIVVPLVGFIYLRCLSHNSDKDRKFVNRDDLPSVSKLVLGFLIGKKEPIHRLIEENNFADKSKELLRIVVKEFTFTPDELRRFTKLCGESKSGLFYIFPHTIAQRCILSIISNQHFPVSLIGALHLKSFFELHNAKLMERFISQQNQADSEGFSLVAKYWGMVPNPKKGTDIVITLELFCEQGKGNSPVLVWTEVFVLYTRQTVRNCQPNQAAQAILTECSKHYDFTNLVTEQTQTNKTSVLASVKDTWDFGLLSNDINPIHMNTFVARLLGHKSRIAHGALVLGKVFSVLEAQHDGVVPARWGVSLKGPIACNQSVAIVQHQPPVSTPPPATTSSSPSRSKPYHPYRQHIPGHDHHEVTPVDEKKHKKEEESIPHFDLFAAKSTRPNICVRVLS